MAPPRVFDDLKDKDWRVRLNAVRILAALPLPGAPSALASALADEAAGVRWAALEALGAFPTDILREHAEALLPCLSAGSWRERRCAVLALGRLGADDLLGCRDCLVERLGDDDPEVREAAAQALEKLQAFLEHEDADFRATAISTLGQLPASVLAPHASRLARCLSDRTSAVRSAAALAIRQLGKDAILDHAPAFGQLLSDNDAAARRAALEAFTALPPEDLAICAHLLRPLLLGTRSKSKRLALGALLKLRPRDLWQFLDDLVSALEDEGWRVRLAAVCALERLGPRVAEVGMAARAVAAQLRGPSQLCCAALRVLGRFDPKRLADLAPVVAQRLREEGASFRFYVLEEMSGLEPEVLAHHAVAIMSMLADGDWRVREAALKVAGRLAPRLLHSVVGRVAGLLGDPAAPVRRGALRALARAAEGGAEEVELPLDALQHCLAEALADAEDLTGAVALLGENAQGRLLRKAGQEPGGLLVGRAVLARYSSGKVPKSRTRASSQGAARKPKAEAREQCRAYRETVYMKGRSILLKRHVPDSVPAWC